MLPQKRSKVGLIVSVIISAILIASAILILLFRQHIIDQITVWQFQPTTEIATIATRDGMNDGGKFLFYASRPELDTAKFFNSVCSRLENSASILGCYSNYHIYIYDVTDQQLDGIRETTAAHEMLHAAYARMSDSEKKTVDILLEAEYKKLEGNKNFADLIAFYARTEPGERDNELHSVIGTEVANLDPALEAHYAKYFSNRQSVVALYTKYSGVFQSLADRADSLSSQLSTLMTSITNASSQYNTDVQTLNGDIAAFNKRAEAGDFTSQGEFNAERASLTARVNALDSNRSSINNDIATYNSLLSEYNSIASQSKKLYSSIDSTLAPAPSVN
jgi:hypothetical protein